MEILDHFSELRCGYCHKISFFSRMRPLELDVAWANEIIVLPLADDGLRKGPAVRGIE